MTGLEIKGLRHSPTPSIADGGAQRPGKVRASTKAPLCQSLSGEAIFVLYVQLVRLCDYWMEQYHESELYREDWDWVTASLGVDPDPGADRPTEHWT